MGEDRYTGRTGPGETPATRRIRTSGGELELRKVSVGSMDNNAYVLHDPTVADDGVDTLVIDAAADGPRILDVVGDGRVGLIVTTHRHHDHWGALDEVAAATGAPVAAGVDDADAIGHPVDHRLAHGDVIGVAGMRLRVRHTPGHTPGSVCLLLEGAEGTGDHLFTGDTLFPGGPGNTFGDADAFTRIMASLEERIFDLPDDTWVYPGHGDDTTLGAERPHLDEWRERGW